jgi:hypothetical protein
MTTLAFFFFMGATGPLVDSIKKLLAQQLELAIQLKALDEQIKSLDNPLFYTLSITLLNDYRGLGSYYFARVVLDRAMLFLPEKEDNTHQLLIKIGPTGDYTGKEDPRLQSEATELMMERIQSIRQKALRAATGLR